MNQEPLLLKVPQVQALIGLGRTRTWQLISSGDIPSIRLGHSVRVSRKALEAWVARKAKAHR